MKLDPNTYITPFLSLSFVSDSGCINEYSIVFGIAKYNVKENCSRVFFVLRDKKKSLE